MKLFKLCLWRCIDQFWLIMILLLQFFFMICGVMIAVSSVQEYSYGYRLLNTVRGLDKGLYFTINDIASYQADYEFQNTDGEVDYSNFASIQNHSLQLLNNIDGISGIANIDYSYFDISEGSFPLYIYNESMCENIQLPLQDGRWLKDASETDVYEIVVDAYLGTIYPVGSFMELTFTEYDSITHESQYIKETYEVIGILGIDGYAFNMLSGGNALKAMDFFEQCTGYAIIAESDYVGGIHQNLAGTRLVFPEDPASIDDIKNKLQRIGTITTMHEVRENSKQYMLRRITSTLPSNSMLALLTFLGLLGVSCFTTYYYARETAIYFICGAKTPYLYAIELLRFSCLYFVALAIAYFAAFKSNTLNLSYLDNMTFLLACTISAFMVAVTLCVSLMFQRSHNPSIIAGRS